MSDPGELGLFEQAVSQEQPYRAKPSRWFRPQRIVLAKGALETPRRRAFVESICGLYPMAEIVERLDCPHNRVELGPADAAELVELGKRTLVIGVHGSAVRRSEERGNNCPNYWHFSPYGFCPFHCAYCYLAGTPGVRFSPTVKVFLNLDEMLARIDAAAMRMRTPTALYVGKLQDGLALDPLTGYSRTMVRFFARHAIARLVVLTKSDEVDNLLGLDHRGHTVLSWTVNPPEVHAAFEPGTPSTEERIEAMSRCAAAGYPVRAVVMPIIPLPDWPNIYERFLGMLLERVPIERLTLGSICIYPAAREFMERGIGRGNPISLALREAASASADGRSRFDRALRIRMYQHAARVAREHRRDLEVGLCLEELPVVDAVRASATIGKCNCIL